MDKNRIKKYLYAALILLTALFIAYQKGWIGANFESITPKEAHAMLQGGQNVVLLDVRTPQEYKEGHIEGATLIPLGELEQRVSELKSQKDKKIIVYCRSGTRSVSASRILSDNGFAPLNVKGGISEWKSEGLLVVK